MAAGGGVMIAVAIPAGPALADPSGSFSFTVSGAGFYTDSSESTAASVLTQVNTIDLTAATITAQPGATGVFAGAAGMPAGAFAIDGDTIVADVLSLGESGFSFADSASLDAFGSFTASDDLQVLSPATVGANAQASFFIDGTTSGGGDLLADSATITLSLTQTGGAGAAISLSGTFAAPAVQFNVAEPASIAVMAISMLGLGFVRRRAVTAVVARR
jgi:hypothetical protein